MAELPVVFVPVVRGSMTAAMLVPSLVRLDFYAGARNP
jgi:hypothetical protein